MMLNFLNQISLQRFFLSIVCFFTLIPCPIFAQTNPSIEFIPNDIHSIALFNLDNEAVLNYELFLEHLPLPEDLISFVRSSTYWAVTIALSAGIDLDPRPSFVWMKQEAGDEKTAWVHSKNSGKSHKKEAKKHPSGFFIQDSGISWAKLIFTDDQYLIAAPEYINSYIQSAKNKKCGSPPLLMNLHKKPDKTLVGYFYSMGPYPSNLPYDRINVFIKYKNEINYIDIEFHVMPQQKKYFINKLNRIILQSDGTSQYEFRKLNEDADWETGPLSEEGMKVLQNARRSGKISVKGNQITLKYAISDDTAYRLE